METKVFDKAGKESGTIKLSDAIFNVKVNKPLLWENVTMLLRNKRTGSANTKNKAEVRGGGKKPYRQKGIGWARHGTNRSPLWKGGGVVFGPKPRDYSISMPRKKKMKALLSSLSAKAQENRILVIEDIHLESSKTKNLAALMRSMNLVDAKTLVGTDAIARNMLLASRNIPHVTVKRVDDINCLDVLLAEYVLITKKGLAKLEQRCSTKK